MDNELSCPRCKTNKYRNPALKLLVNVCGHSLCENCVDLLFVKGSASCPRCGLSLRRTNFRTQLFEDAIVEKEVDIRKRILRDFNKKEEDFDTLDEFNDYLEFVETIIYNLTNNIDVDSTKRKIEQFKKENSDIIVRNRNKLSREEEEIEGLLEHEKEKERWRHQTYDQQEIEISRAKKRQKEAIVDDLMFSNLPANQILANHMNEKLILEKKQAEQPLKPPVMKPYNHATFSSGIKVGRGSSVFLPVPKNVDEPAYTYVKAEFDLEGPMLPKIENLSSDGYLQYVRESDPSEKAAGFLPSYPCYRALQEAFCGLFYEPDS